MNTLFVVHYPVFGGPHNQALRLAKPLAARGWNTLVLIPDEPGSARERLRAGGVDVATERLHRLRAKPSLRLQLNFLFGFVPAINRIRRVIRERQIDLVMIGGLVNPHAAIAARLEGVPVVWQILDTRTPRPLVKLLMPVVKRLADSILVTGMDVATAHPGATDFGDRLFPFFPPVDTDVFTARADARSDARRELGVDADSRLIGKVSNVNPQKDQMNFVRAAGLVHRERRDVKFAILGATYPEHADYLRAIEDEALAVGLTLGEDLIFHDPGAEVARFGAALDIFWLSSEPRSEGIPTVVEEAMSLGLPVVSTDVGSVREAVVDGETGFVVPPRDPQSLAEATLRLLDDDELRGRMGKAARDRAVAKFAVDHCTDVHVAAFEAAMAHHAARR